MTTTQHRILSLLAERGPMTMTDLARSMAMSHGLFRDETLKETEALWLAGHVDKIQCRGLACPLAWQITAAGREALRLEQP